ncbi:J domain-containing protein [Alkalinema pantanalense CENA528]|uniref:J domain-containing protein n=1 Tax=Alkalinema pantanalense TaxID=1620705 RepID=UPI003D6E4550
MTQKSSKPSQVPVKDWKEATYYDRLGLHPAASVIAIRRAYRDLSKLYHPDTTQLPPAIAKQAFQELNEAYATLSSPERRLAYDQTIGYSRVAVICPLPKLYEPSPQYDPLASSYLDPNDRPLSAGELFALFILGVTLIGCIVLALVVGFTQSSYHTKFSYHTEVSLLTIVCPDFLPSIIHLSTTHHTLG